MLCEENGKARQHEVCQPCKRLYMTLSKKKQQYFTTEKDQERVYASSKSAGDTQCKKKISEKHGTKHYEVHESLHHSDLC